MLKHLRGHHGPAKAPQRIFCSPATVMGEGKPWSHAHLNLLVGDIIVHHTGGVWTVVLGGAGPPVGGRMGSSFPGHLASPSVNPSISEGFLHCSPSFAHKHSTLPYPTLHIL